MDWSSPPHSARISYTCNVGVSIGRPYNGFPITERWTNGKLSVERFVYEVSQSYPLQGYSTSVMSF